jgi:hypothetical protein
VKNSLTKNLIVMKKLIVIKRLVVISVLFCWYSLYAQQNSQFSNTDRIAISIFIPEQVENISMISTENVENKLIHIITQQGMANLANQRFVLIPRVAVQTKDIVASVPAKHVYTLDVTLYIGDAVSGNLFSSITVNLKGVGDTETKAYISAFNNLKSTPDIIKFIATGKEKIIAYYNDQCEVIIKEAQTLSSMNKYEAALAQLAIIPSACRDCYMRALNEMKPIYQKYIDHQCKMKLQTATAIWTSSQDYQSATNAGAILSEIDPDAACFSEAKTLFNKIEQRILEIDKREWNYILKEQQQESERIEAMRAIGVAYGNNQPKEINYYHKSWW